MARNLGPMSESHAAAGSQAEALVRALQQGDRDAFATLYEQYADRIYSYCVSICRNPDWAADAMQDAFLLAFSRISQLRDPSKLRPWLYAVARNECLRQLRVHRREADLAVAGETVDVNATPDGELDAADARSLIDAAFVAMNTSDRDVLDLALRQDLDNASIASVLKVSENNASAKVSRAKSQLETAVRALLLFRSRGSNCPKLKESLGNESDFNVLSRKRISRHAQECDQCSSTRIRALAAIAMAGLPILAAPSWIKELLVESPVVDPGHLTASDSMNLELPSNLVSDGASSGNVPSGDSPSDYVANETTYVTAGDTPPMSVADRAALVDKNRPAYDKDGWPQSPTKQKPKAPFAVAGVALVAVMGSALVLAVGAGSSPQQVPSAASSIAASASSSTSQAPKVKAPKPTKKPTATPTPASSLKADAGGNAGDETSGSGDVANPAPKQTAPKAKPKPAPAPAPAPVPGGPSIPRPVGPPDLAAPPDPIPG